MRNKFQVTDETKETYEGKRGTMHSRMLTLLDVGEGARMKQLIDWNAAEHKIDVGDTIVLDITEISMFSNRPRVRAVLVEE